MKTIEGLGIGLEAGRRRAIGERLNALLADHAALAVKARNFHWNVAGPNFSELHRLFQTIYEGLDQAMDDIAERVRALDEIPAGSLREFLAKTRLRECSGAPLPAPEMIEALLRDHESIIRALRADLVWCLEEGGDAGTSDFLTGLMERHEKTAWMLRSHLEGR